ncbi:hypothetical protein FRX31_007332, partial [Thalictrum thalictroides]
VKSLLISRLHPDQHACQTSSGKNNSRKIETLNLTITSLVQIYHTDPADCSSEEALVVHTEPSLLSEHQPAAPAAATCSPKSPSQYSPNPGSGPSLCSYSSLLSCFSPVQAKTILLI